MATKRINNTILIAPLDWGLGHATRCIPIIDTLLQKKCRVLIAANGPHKILLQEVFPEAEFLHLDGYGIKYANKNLLFHLAKQLPRFLQTIKNERIWLDKTIDEHGVNLIISDNRYGLWSKKIPCVFVTHQLQLQLPFFMQWAKKWVQKKMYGFINRFSLCWVPDVADKKENLSGMLGHPFKMPTIPIIFIGPLSRFSRLKKNYVEEKKYALMVCLSGPEPQRSLFESIILPQFKNIDGHVLLIRGKPGSTDILHAADNVTIYNHLPTRQLRQAFEQSNFIVSRCGYSTLMDMQVLGCKCIYVPTPGQTEQEYLGKRLYETGGAVVCKQHGFNLEKAIKSAKSFNYTTRFFEPLDALENEITRVLKMI